ncbi:stage V sporulation protein AA [Lottiidibacillus patelloidae]|uniref:Stage V sporulation protein AA n=1 Tax=Lottiidibacillus patelloidae TaxID=2670334 RepID=A0A263BUY0_9BACI|nr:stage V sporulation protein AA [Lottiidibacillus patelloidae]OZM57137.1 stage V sporulation protein AA [Lottiidibacillus patelloidae]
MEFHTIYLRMRNRVHVSPNMHITLKDVAQVVAHEEIAEDLRSLQVYSIKPHDKTIVVLDVMKIVSTIQEHFKNIDVQTIGPAQTIVEVVYKKKKLTSAYFAFVWLLLFFGAALAIMNFHEDVSMREVHQRIHYIVTGEVSKYPLLLQIPYSLGLGIGMVLFFNHFFRKRLNEEPSPLEVEMHNYQLDLDQYVIVHENKESVKNLDDAD